MCHEMGFADGDMLARRLAPSDAEAVAGCVRNRSLTPGYIDLSGDGHYPCVQAKPVLVEAFQKEGLETVPGSSNATSALHGVSSAARFLPRRNLRTTKSSRI